MTYNQVQSFQINDYANYYVNIEITGYRALYSKSIAGRGSSTDKLHLVYTAGPVDCINRLFDCYIRVYRSFQVLLVGYSQLLVGPTLGYAPEMRHSTNLQILEFHLCDHTHQLEYGKHDRKLLQVRFIIHFHSRSEHPRSCYQK